MKIKIRQSDKFFSQYVRERDNWRCQYCQRLCKIGGEMIYKLDASHYIGRANEKVRFFSDNVYSLCFSCHQKLVGYTKSGTGEYDLFVKKRLGEERYKKLLVQAFQTTKKRDDFLDALYAKKLLEEL